MGDREANNEVAEDKGEGRGLERARSAASTQTSRTLAGRNIRTLRTSRDMKLLALADLTGIDAGSLSRIERGLQGWTPEVLDAIANALGVPVASFFERNRSANAWNAGSILIPQYRKEQPSLEESGPLIPFPRAWLPKGVRTAGLVALTTQDHSCDYLVDTKAKDLEDGKLFAFTHSAGERVRRVFTRFDRAVRLVVDAPSPETSEEVIPPTAIDELQVIGRVVWGGGPL